MSRSANPTLAPATDRKGRISRASVPYLLTIPAGFGLAVLVLGPVFGVLAMSLTNWQLGSLEAEFIGIENYWELFADSVFRRSFLNTLIYVAIVVPSVFALGLAGALAIESSKHLKGFYRTAIFLPATATVVALAVVWDFMLHPTLGLFNDTLNLLGLQGRNWLREEGTVLIVLAVIGVWLKTGYLMVLFLAGLSKIPRVYYEAAAVDGVQNSWDRFRYVTWPQLGPTSLFVAVIATIQAFQTFETVAILTEGGPNNRSEVLLHTLYVEGFRFFRTGYAAALTVVFLIIILGVTAVNVSSSRPRGTGK